MLRALREKLMRPDVFQEFYNEYVRELNRLRIEHRARTSNMRHELVTVQREIEGLIDAILDGVPGASIKDRMLVLETRKAELKEQLEIREVPQLIHTSIAEVYRQKVTELCQALKLAQDAKRSPETGDLMLQVQLVAGGI